MIHDHLDAGRPDQVDLIFQVTLIIDRRVMKITPVWIGRRVTADNWNALRAVGEHANKRLCDAHAVDIRSTKGNSRTTGGPPR